MSDLELRIAETGQTASFDSVHFSTVHLRFPRLVWNARSVHWKEHYTIWPTGRGTSKEHSLENGLQKKWSSKKLFFFWPAGRSIGGFRNSIDGFFAFKWTQKFLETTRRTKSYGRKIWNLSAFSPKNHRSVCHVVLMAFSWKFDRTSMDVLANLTSQSRRLWPMTSHVRTFWNGWLIHGPKLTWFNEFIALS